MLRLGNFEENCLCKFGSGLLYILVYRIAYRIGTINLMQGLANIILSNYVQVL